MNTCGTIILQWDAPHHAIHVHRNMGPTHVLLLSASHDISLSLSLFVKKNAASPFPFLSFTFSPLASLFHGSSSNNNRGIIFSNLSPWFISATTKAWRRRWRRRRRQNHRWSSSAAGDIPQSLRLLPVFSAELRPLFSLISRFRSRHSASLYRAFQLLQLREVPDQEVRAWDFGFWGRRCCYISFVHFSQSPQVRCAEISLRGSLPWPSDPVPRGVRAESPCE